MPEALEIRGLGSLQGQIVQIVQNASPSFLRWEAPRCAAGSVDVRTFALLLFCTSIACGSGLERPRNVRASVSADAIEVSWEPVPGVSGYRVQLADLDSRAPVGEAKFVSQPRARLPLSRATGVWVDALRGALSERAVGFVTGGAAGGDGSAWQIFGPADFRNGSVHVS